MSYQSSSWYREFTEIERRCTCKSSINLFSNHDDHVRHRPFLSGLGASDSTPTPSKLQLQTNSKFWSSLEEKNHRRQLRHGSSLSLSYNPCAIPLPNQKLLLSKRQTIPLQLPYLVAFFPPSPASFLSVRFVP